MKKIILIMLLGFLVGCIPNYSEQYEKLIKLGMNKPCATYILIKLKDASEAEKLVFANTCNKAMIFIDLCGGMEALNKNELKFLKCMTNLK